MNELEGTLRRKIALFAGHLAEIEDLHGIDKPDSHEHKQFRGRKSFPKTSRWYQVITEVDGKRRPPPYPSFDRPWKAGQNAFSDFVKGWSLAKEDFDEPSVTFLDPSGKIHKHVMKILTTDTDSRAKRPYAEELREWFTVIADKIYETGMTLSE
jgi:hypothetical protein